MSDTDIVTNIAQHIYSLKEGRQYYHDATKLDAAIDHFVRAKAEIERLRANLRLRDEWIDGHGQWWDFCREVLNKKQGE